MQKRPKGLRAPQQGSPRQRRAGMSLRVLLTLSMVAAAVSAGPASAHQVRDEIPNLPDVAAPEVDDPISEAEIQDLQTIAVQKGMSLQAVIDRYAWNDNFALTVQRISEAAPDSYAGAAVVDANHAWIAFAGQAPESAGGVLAAFSNSHAGVSVDIRTNLGFSEVELQQAIEKIHYAVFEAGEVRDAVTSFDYGTGQITTLVVLESGVSESVLDSFRVASTKLLADVAGVDISDSVTVDIVLSNRGVIGGDDSGTEHLGGEDISGCTSGFGTKTAGGTRGISTAGHCGNSQSDDGSSLTYQAGYQGTHGDFQWHTGPDTERDDFYAGNSTTLEVNRRDVSSVGAPTVGQALCKNGVTNKKDCQDVRKLNVCNGSRCNLVQMEERLAAGGDSGGPVFYNYTAYGLHQGYVYDPVWPFDRDVFSRADRIDNALGINVATS